MNKTEARYAQMLERMCLAGIIRSWGFEAIRLELAFRTWYTPDFMVEMSDGSLEFHEIKGHLRDDANVKWKVAAKAYPQFGWRMLRLVNDEWTEIKAAAGRAGA